MAAFKYTLTQKWYDLGRKTKPVTLEQMQQYDYVCFTGQMYVLHCKLYSMHCIHYVTIREPKYNLF